MSQKKNGQGGHLVDSESIQLEKYLQCLIKAYSK